MVGENDLAAQLRKRPDIVSIELNLLLGEQKVQKAPLNGYWKLNVRSKLKFALIRRSTWFGSHKFPCTAVDSSNFEIANR